MSPPDRRHGDDRRAPPQGGDAGAPPSTCPPSLPARGLMALVRFYRLFFKAWLGNACRFEPSCSAYALDALQRHGAGVGAYLTTARLLRCHPWCDGGCDPVPDAAPRLFTRLLSKSRP